MIELDQKYPTLKSDFIELSKPRHPDLDQHDLENLFDEFGNWFASSNDFGKQSSKTAQKWAVSWLTWVNNNKHKIIARKAKSTTNEQPIRYQGKQSQLAERSQQTTKFLQQHGVIPTSAFFDDVIEVVPDNPKFQMIEEVGHA